MEEVTSNYQKKALLIFQILMIINVSNGVQSDTYIQWKLIHKESQQLIKNVSKKLDFEYIKILETLTKLKIGIGISAFGY